MTGNLFHVKENYEERKTDGIPHAGLFRVVSKQRLHKEVGATDECEGLFRP